MNQKKNYNLSINLELIRTIYKWLSRKTTSLGTSEIMNRFYKYVDEDFFNENWTKGNMTEKDIIKQCKDRYDNFVTNSFIEKSVANKLIESGIPANCLRTDSATKLLPLSADEYSSAQTIFEYQLFDFIDEKIRAKFFMDVLTHKDMEKLDRILANIPTEKICFILLLVHHLMKQIHYKTATDSVYTFIDMLETATYDPNNESEVALMENILSQVQRYITPEAKIKIELVEPITKNISSQAFTVQKKTTRRQKTQEEKHDKLFYKNVDNIKMAKNALLIREACKLVAEAMGFGGKSFSRKFYTFLDIKSKEIDEKNNGEEIDINEAIKNDKKEVKNNHYHKFVEQGYITPQIKELFITYGIPQKCFDKDNAELIPTTGVINDILKKIYILKKPDQIDAELHGTVKDTDAILKEDLNEALKEYLFAENPTDSNILFSSAKRIVQAIYESTCFAPNTSEALCDLLEDLNLYEPAPRHPDKRTVKNENGEDVAVKYMSFKDMKEQLEKMLQFYYENDLVEKDEDIQNA